MSTKKNITKVSDDASEDEVMAAILTIFAGAINPSVDRELAYEVICSAMEQGGIGMHNAAQWGTLVKQTAHGVRSYAKH